MSIKLIYCGHLSVKLIYQKGECKVTIEQQKRYMFAIWIRNFDRFIPEWEYDYMAGYYDRMPQGCDKVAVSFAFDALVAMGEG
jgi:hypothetical protein